MKRTLLNLSLFAFLGFANSGAYGQISQGGEPFFLQTRAAKDCMAKSQLNIPTISLPRINNDSLILQDLEREDHLKLCRFAKCVDVDINIVKSGSWRTLKNGDQVCLIEIHSKNATSLNFILDYQLQQGAKLFIYNQATGKVLGSYTSKNNKPWKELAIQPISGDKIVFEYYVPKNVNKGILGIKTVGHGYKSYNSFGRSKDCQFDINGEKGQGWQNEKRSVVRIIIQTSDHSFSYSSGVLVNNTNQDKKPYVLTCEHAINDKATGNPDYTPEMGARNSIYFFNYESKEIGQDGDQSQSISGATLRATKPTIDFALLELSIDIPENYKPFFSGWDLNDQEFNRATVISHPKGDVKKIAATISIVKPYQTFGSEYPYDNETHWKIKGWDFGSLEGGSSGAPIFNNDHLVVGNLSGGTSHPCNSSIDEVNSFQMISYMWKSSIVPSQQLKHWLDPKGSNVERLNSYDPYATDKVYFYPDKQISQANDPVIFKDYSIGSYSNYRWNFGVYANPSTAIGTKEVAVTYSKTGFYSASLTVTDENGEDKTFKLKNYIQIVKEGLKPDFSTDKVIADINKPIRFQNLSKGAKLIKWDFGSGSQFIGQKNENTFFVKYLSEGKKTVSLTAISDTDQKTITKVNCITIGEKLKVKASVQSGPYLVGKPIKFLGSSNKEESVDYWFFWKRNDGQEENKRGKEAVFTFNKPGTYNITFEGNSNGYSVSDLINIKVGDIPTGIKDNSLTKNSFKVFPNPCSEVLHIKLPFHKCLLQLYSSTGKMIYSKKISSKNHSINCSNFLAGIYILVITHEFNRISKKILIR